MQVIHRSYDTIYVSEVVVNHRMLTKNGDTTRESVSEGTQQIVFEGLEGIGGKGMEQDSVPQKQCLL